MRRKRFFIGILKNGILFQRSAGLPTADFCSLGLLGEIPKLPKVADVEYRLHFWDLETQKEVRVLTTGRVSMLPEMEKQRRELEAEAAKKRAIYEERKRMQKERSPSPAPVPVRVVREL